MGQKPSRCLHFDCKNDVYRGRSGKRIYCDIHECQYKNCHAMIFNTRHCGEHIWRDFRK